MLNLIIDHISGKKQLDVMVKNPKKMGWLPHECLKKCLEIYLNLAVSFSNVFYKKLSSVFQRSLNIFLMNKDFLVMKCFKKHII